MIKCAIVEDDEAQANTIRNYITQYSVGSKTTFDVKLFSNAVIFLENYSADCDIVFIDIKMPYLNGIEASRLLREKDEDVVLIFVTSLAQYAIVGYSVNACDYLLKPVSYSDFKMALLRAMRRIGRKEDVVTISAKEGTLRIKISNLVYVESLNHTLIYHTEDRQYERYASLKTAIKELEGKGFSLCNRCYLVNLNFVKNIKGYTLTLNGGEELQISQPRKKQFINDFKLFSGN